MSGTAETIRARLRDLALFVADSDAPFRQAGDQVEAITDATVALDRLETALERIATGKRPDGSYNLSREACEQIAREALR